MPFVAAFFPAEESVKTANKSEGKISVWAINRDSLKHTDLELVTQRRHKISYLHAQGGLFLYDKQANKYFLENRGAWRSFDQVVESASLPLSERILRKITLPTAQSWRLMQLLIAENVTRAHLMPTYDNVTETLRMKRILNNRTLE